MAIINESTVFCLIIIFMSSNYLWSVYLYWRQYKIVKSPVTSTPEALKKVMDERTLEKARKYLKSRLKFALVRETASFLLTTIGLYTNLQYTIWVLAENISNTKSEVIVSNVWTLILTLMDTLIALPLVVYDTFVLEEKYGFNKQTVRFFMVDKLKEFVVTQCLLIPMNSVAIVVIKYTGPFFFLWLFLAETTIVLVMMIVYPLYIAPLFDKFTTLPDGELRVEITKIANELSFPLTDIYVIDGSSRSSHSNAYFTGLFNSKRIVLYDTLLNNPKMDNNQIIAVLCHEFGHWQHGHIMKHLVMVEMDFFVTCLIFSALFESPLVYKAVGFTDSQPVLVGLLVIVNYLTIWYNLAVYFVVTNFSRQFEFQADAFAAQMGKAEDLKKALVQLSKDNLNFPIYDWLYSDWFHSHPPLLERLNALD